MMKRFIDVVIAAIMLAVFALPMACVAFLIFAKMGRPVLLRQMRPGRHAKPFICFKFRTMTDAVDARGQLLPDAQRLTPLGAFLRKTSLDELPQLINVIKGEMSLVGPRPLLMEYLPLYSSEQARRHEVQPGITGWAQVNGRNALDWEERFELDLWYVEHRSFWLDLKIIAKTVWRMLRPQGIVQPGHATMSKFTGSQRARNN